MIAYLISLWLNYSDVLLTYDFFVDKLQIYSLTLTNVWCSLRTDVFLNF